MAKKRIPELNVERVQTPANLHFLCMLEYKRDEYLCIVDNITPATIGAYVLDYADQENVPLNELLSVATKWFYAKSDNHPLSVEVASLGLTERLAPIFRTFDTAYVSRIVGHAFTYEAMNKTRVRRRRVISIPEGIEIRLKPKISA